MSSGEDGTHIKQTSNVFVGAYALSFPCAYANNFFGDMDQTQVEVILEDYEKSFMMYKDLACFHSECFRGAFNRSFRESEEKCLRLSDVTKGTFRLFQFLLYAQATREENDPTLKKHSSEHRLDVPASRSVMSWKELKVNFMNVAPVSKADLKVLGLNEPHQYHNLFVGLYVFAD
jgi:hypothetical protein